MVDHPHNILTFDQTIHFLKLCHSINKQFSILFLIVRVNTGLSGLSRGHHTSCLSEVTSDGFGSIFCGWDRVSHLWSGFEFVKFPLKMSKFSIFSLRVKKISSGRLKEYLGQRRVSLLFTAGQK